MCCSAFVGSARAPSAKNMPRSEALGFRGLMIEGTCLGLIEKRLSNMICGFLDEGPKGTFRG